MDEKGGKEQVKQIQLALQNSTSRERDALKNLAASKAWLHCMKRLGSAERTALMAWAAEAKEVRTGTGRYAERHRENARQYLDQCRSAIPCWVMPLYQLVQTVRPGRSIFDVVIIDEASQSGADAWLINYIADRTIVVGDPQQIAPMNVGLELEQVEYLRRKHLKDIPLLLHSDLRTVCLTRQKSGTQTKFAYVSIFAACLRLFSSATTCHTRRSR